MKKPKWVVEKEQTARRVAVAEHWLFGLHAVEAALLNSARIRSRLVITRNAAQRLEAAITASGMTPEIADPRKFPVPLDAGSVHQGAALSVRSLDWGDLGSLCDPGVEGRPLVVLLDRVSDPQNVGAILRSAEVFGATAVVAPARHSAPETGALAKAASGALERQPYVRVQNLARAMSDLRAMGYALLGLDGNSDRALAPALSELAGHPLGLVMGAEGPGLRHLTTQSCDALARIDSVSDFGSLNVSNAAAVSLYAARQSLGQEIDGDAANFS